MVIWKAQDITAGYGKHKVCDKLSFSLENGLTALLGRNGCGKTTLLKSLCCILPHEGQSVIYTDVAGDDSVQTMTAGNDVSGSCTGNDVSDMRTGNDISGMRTGAGRNSVTAESLSSRELAKYCGYIPQRSGISVDISLTDAVLMGFNPYLGLLQNPTAAMRKAALDALDEAGLSHKSEDSFLTLSEGQKQLAILARTLVKLPPEISNATHSRMLFLDEPESSLDFDRRYRSMQLIRTRCDQFRSMGALISLHDPQLALNTCDRLLLMENGTSVTMIDLKTTPDAEIESALSRIFGPLKVFSEKTDDGRTCRMIAKNPQG